MRSLLSGFLIILCSVLAVKAQVHDERRQVSVEGFITNPEGQYIEQVHIVNTRQGTGTASNSSGQFRIISLPGDTLRFTGIGYSPYSFFVPSVRTSPVVPLHVVMEADTIILTGATIYAWPADADALKREVLSMESQAPEVPDLKLNNPKFYTKPLPDGFLEKNGTPGMLNPGLSLVTIKGPFTALYNKYSREGKSLRKYVSLKNQDDKTVIAAKRYNADVVRRITSFKTDKEIQDFMLFCNLSVDFVVRVTEYELYEAINECLLAYNSGIDGNEEK